MSLTLPQVRDRYSPPDEKVRNEEIERADRLNRKLRTHIVVSPGEEIHLFSPNGTKYAITVSNAGVLGTVPR